jgi:hypothetical protein
MTALEAPVGILPLELLGILFVLALIVGFVVLVVKLVKMATRTRT